MKMKMLLQFLVVLSLGEFGRGQTFPSCVDISSTAGFVNCANWQRARTSENCLLFPLELPIVTEPDGTRFIYNDGYLDDMYANSVVCAWTVRASDECNQVFFLALDKDFDSSEPDNGEDCANRDNLAVENSRDSYCGGASANQCASGRNCLGVFQIARLNENLVLKLRTDESNTSPHRGILGVTFEVPDPNCNSRRRKRSSRYDDYLVPPRPYCPQHQSRYKKSYYPPSPHKYYYYKPPCECFGRCTGRNQAEEARLALLIIQDSTGWKAWKFVNSPSEFLRGVARLTLQNIRVFNATLPTRAQILNQSCPSFIPLPEPKFRRTHYPTKIYYPKPHYKPTTQYTRPPPTTRYTRPPPTTRYTRPPPTTRYTRPPPTTRYTRPPPTTRYTRPPPTTRYTRPPPTTRYTRRPYTNTRQPYRNQYPQ